MHPCLQIPELLSRIIEACAPGYRDQSSSSSCSRLGTVSALARTCHAFQDPALDVLWYSQHGLSNLLQCLPNDKWELQESDGMVRGLPENLVTKIATVQRSARFAGVLKPEAISWSRFDFYAFRVRKLHSPARCYSVRIAGSPKSIYMDLTVLSALRQAPLLPNLQFIEYWSPFSGFLDHPDQFLTCLATPSLRFLDMTLETRGGRELSSALANVFTHCISLSSLRLRARIGDVDLSLLSAALAHCSHFRSLILRLDSDPSHRIGPKLLSELASLPKLHELKLYSWIPYDRHSHKPPREPPRLIIFPCLTSLELLTYDVPSATTILGLCTFKSLKRIVLFSECAAVHMLPPLLKSQICHETLESLSIHAGSRSPTEKLYARDPVVHYSELLPLLVFRQLQHVSVSVTGRHGLHFDDEGWEAFARAWPRLRTLRMTGAADVETATSWRSGSGCVLSTYKSFAHLARWCPDIHAIDIIITDAGTPGSFDIGALQSLPVNRHVSTLHFHHSSLNNPINTALWVSVMFPCVARTSRTGSGTKVESGDRTDLPLPGERASIAW